MLGKRTCCWSTDFHRSSSWIQSWGPSRGSRRTDPSPHRGSRRPRASCRPSCRGESARSCTCQVFRAGNRRRRPPLILPCKTNSRLHNLMDTKSLSDLMLSQQPISSTSSQHSTLSMVSDQKPPSRWSLVHTEKGLPPALISSGHVKLQPYEAVTKSE